jgi:hypothetical protein
MPLSDLPIAELRVSRAQAIALAEQHVLVLGWARHHRLELDRSDWFWRSAMKDFGGTLLPRALGATRGPNGWTVTFRRRVQRNTGHAVTMDRFGRKIRLELREIALT